MIATSALALAVLAGGLYAADAFKSGPEVGEKLQTPFEPLNVNGSAAGQKKCQFCANGSCPVVMVFAREVSDPVKKLIKEVDAATVKNGDAKMGSFFVFLGDEEATEAKLKDLVKSEDLKKTILCVDGNSSPEVEAYKVAKDADVTVVLYTNRVVKANHSFKKGAMTDKDVEKVIADLPKILPSK
jgi:hypothetical protein